MEILNNAFNHNGISTLVNVPKAYKLRNKSYGPQYKEYGRERCTNDSSEAINRLGFGKTGQQNTKNDERGRMKEHVPRK